MSLTLLDPHFFRHEHGRLVAVLSRRLGVQHLEAIEDAVQSALLSAVEVWPRQGTPAQPSAWLFRAAHNHVISELRKQARRDRIVERRGAELTEPTSELPEAGLVGDVRDDLVRLLFACCDEALPIDAQLALALKTLCGFEVREIAERLFTTEANVYKRLGRARERLRTMPREVAELSLDQLLSRLPAVLAVLHVMFTEGYLSSHAEDAIRRDLCDEAKRLVRILAEYSVTATPETFALLALMHLHSARMSSRQDGSGGLLLLEEQDRAQWSVDEIHVGLSWLARSAAGSVFSRYHAEAAIAAEHCIAPTFADTRWDKIVACYELLERSSPSALHTLNRAVAVAELHGPPAGLAVIERLAPPSWLEGSYLWSAVLADLHRRCGHAELAEGYAQSALRAAPSSAVRAALQRRLRIDGLRHRFDT